MKIVSVQFSSVQSVSHVWLFETTWTAACQVSLSITNFLRFHKLIPLSQWCHPTISSSVVPFSSCLQSFAASGSFQMSQLFAAGGQSIRASAPASVFSINIQGWFPLGLTGLISLLSKELSRVFSSTTVRKHWFFRAQPYLLSNSHIHSWLLETIICAVINSFRGKICCICLQSRSLWTVISPAMWFLLVLCSSFLCLAISIRLAQLFRSAWSEPEAGLSYGAPQSLGTLVT